MVDLHLRFDLADAIRGCDMIKDLRRCSWKISKVTITLEPVGEDKVRINAASWVDPVVMRAKESFQVLAIGKRACTSAARKEIAWMNLDLSGLEDAGYGPKV